ncbi:NAD(P)-dependent oxidoreductase [Streptomyces sp. CB09001]|uniref:NmrA family NAD(P)-binding protein n=1 Tax=Streptomyces sp. CB09001 TaxID=2083284 RepID=UPI000E21A296|nr:NmrA family NAD(P)-binding protein [Streptomyces sp. CB09001]AXL91826.1 NAD(P)-dependent oxidoreductase [Streptomyces sp. CB09001]
MILITTPGKVGSEAARLLAERGEAVRVLARDPAKAAGLSQVGVDVAEGDLNVPASIDAAMRDVTSVVLVSPAVPAQELNVVDSAARADVAHVVKITSKASADSPIARQRGQAEIESGLIASGLEYTLLRSNFYMQNLLMLASAISRTGRFGSSAGAGQVGFIDARDVAAVAAEIASSPDPHIGRTYLLTGPEMLSYAGVAATLTTVLGRSVAFDERTVEEDKQAMMSVGVPEPTAAMNAHAVSLIAEGEAAWLSDDVPAILGRQARTFQQFITDHRAAFS